MSETIPYVATKYFVIIDEENRTYFSVTDEVDARTEAQKMANETGQMVLLFVHVDEFRPDGAVKREDEE